MKTLIKYNFFFLFILTSFAVHGQTRSFFTSIPKSTLFILMDGELPKGVDFKFFPKKMGAQTKIEKGQSGKPEDQEFRYVYVVMSELLPDVNIPKENIEVKVKSKIAITLNQNGEKSTNEETSDWVTPNSTKIYRLEGKIQFIDDPGIKDQQLINNPAAYPISYLGKFHVQFLQDGEVVREAVYQVKLDKEKKDSSPPKADFQLIDALDEQDPQEEAPERPLSDETEEFLDEIPPEDEGEPLDEEN